MMATLLLGREATDFNGWKLERDMLSRLLPAAPLDRNRTYQSSLQKFLVISQTGAFCNFDFVCKILRLRFHSARIF